MLSKILKHMRNGTLGSAVKTKLGTGEDQSGAQTRWTANTEARAVEFLAGRVQKITKDKNSGTIVVIGNPGAVLDAFMQKLGTRLETKVVRPSELKIIRDLNFDKVLCVVSTCFDSRSAFEIGRFLVGFPPAAKTPFENVVHPQIEFDRIEKLDRYHSTSFISPLFSNKVDFISIYEESLTRFGQKCEIRDYLDLCQALSYLVTRKVLGDVAEFGSYKGHSGYLIAETLKQLNSDKKVLLFDAFEEFPKEELGIDYFWDEHQVDFDEVRSKFQMFKNVELVKGDFTQTVLRFPQDLSLVYIDCDSYRATKFLIDHLFEKQLSRGGLLIVEDYGHPALLGSRLAVHDALDNRSDFFPFYSQFSGFYVVVKN